MKCAARGLILALFPLLAARAGDLSGPGLMRNIADAYANISTIHVVAERQDIVNLNGQSRTLLSACELAARNRQLFMARMKRNGVDSLTISDGETTWKALGDRKEWMQISAGASDSYEEAGPANSRDLRTFIAVTAYGQYAALAEIAQNPVIERTTQIKFMGADV